MSEKPSDKQVKVGWDKLGEIIGKVIDDRLESKTFHHFPKHIRECPEPGCDAVNPNYVEPTLFCQDCDKSLGYKEDMEKIERCWNCGGEEAKTKG